MRPVGLGSPSDGTPYPGSPGPPRDQRLLSPHGKVMGGGAGGEGPRHRHDRGEDKTARRMKPTAKGRGNSVTERKMEDYYTKTPRKKAKAEDESQ
jgi:hypothetical protein